MYGTLSTLDTLKSNFQTIAQYGEDNAYGDLANVVDAYNRQIADMTADFLDRTTDRQRRYGTAGLLSMVKGDEFGRAEAQKLAPGVNAGFPLEKYEITVQWTRKWTKNATVAEMAGQVEGVMAGDKQRVITEIQRALFNPTNYSFDDYLVDHLSAVQLQIRALLNADGLGIPTGPNGEIFDGSTHTHYLAADWTDVNRTTPTRNADLVSALETVLEHYAAGEAMIRINRAQEAVVRTLPGFVQYYNPGLVGPTTQVEAPGTSLNTVQLYNRAIGEFNGAVVWVKPWVISNYIVVNMLNVPKTLVMRTRDDASGDLELQIDDERYPLRARTWEREFGIGAWSRQSASILYVGGSSYTAPTLAA